MRAMPSPTDSTWPTSVTSASLPKFCDLLLQDVGNFSGADIHQPTSFMRVRMELSLVLSEPSTMRLPSLHDEAADDLGIDLHVELDATCRRSRRSATA